MINIKDKKTEVDLEYLILSLANNKTTKSIRKKIEFKLGALFVYLLMIKVNTKEIGKDKRNTKKNYQEKISAYIWRNELKSSKCYTYITRKINILEWKKERRLD